MEEMKIVRKRVRDENESPPEMDSVSPEVKRLREDLLDSLDDDPDDICASNQDLDSFMKSFEEEIAASPSGRGGGGSKAVAVDLASDSGDSRPDLGYLLEASDDELGIPPPTADESKDEVVRVEPDSSGFGGEFLEMPLPGYDAFGSGFEESDDYNGGYEALDGLFDYSDLGIGSGEYPWRPETLPAQ